MNLKLAGLVGAMLTLAPVGAVEAMPVAAPPASGAISSAEGATVEKARYYGYRRHYGWRRPYGWHRPWHRRRHRSYRNF